MYEVKRRGARSFWAGSQSPLRSIANPDALAGQVCSSPCGREVHYFPRAASAVAVAAPMYFAWKCATRSRHIPTNASDVSFSTDFHALLDGRKHIAPDRASAPFLALLPAFAGRAHGFQAMRSGGLRCSAAPSQPC